LCTGELERATKADGHTLLMHNNSHAVAPVAFPSTFNFDPIKDFTQLGIVGASPLVQAGGHAGQHPAGAASPNKSKMSSGCWCLTAEADH
jgi:hypothetical protein